MATYFLIGESFLKTLNHAEARLCKAGEIVEVRDDLEPGVSLIPVDTAARTAKKAVKDRQVLQKIDTSVKERGLRAKLNSGQARRLADLETVLGAAI